MADIESKVEIKVTADTKQAMSALSALASGAGNVRANFEGMASGLGKHLDAAAIGLAKFNLALGGINKALQIGKDVWGMTVEMTRLNDVARTLSADTMPKLTKATHGLVTQMELVRVAGKHMVGQLGLDSDQMATVAEAAAVLSQRGFGPFSQVVDQLAQKVKKGGEGLDDFGITFQKTGNKIVDTRKAIEALNGVINANADVLNGQSANLKKAAAAMGDLLNWFKQAAANDVNTAVGVVSQFKADADYWIVRPFKALDGWLASNERRTRDLALAMVGLYNIPPPKWLPANFINNEKSTPRIQKFSGSAKETPNLAAALGMSWVSPSDLSGAVYDMKPDTFTGGGGGGLGGGTPTFVLQHANVVMTDSAGMRLSSLAAQLGALPAGLPTPDTSRPTNPLLGRMPSIRERQGMVASYARDRSSLASASGLGLDVTMGMTGEEAENLRASIGRLNDITTTAGAGFQLMSQAIGASVDAFISGEQSMGRAAIGGAVAALRSLAAQATARAAWNAALAWEQPQFAPKFLTAAAKMAGVAALSASLAAGLGASLNSGGGSGGSGGGGGGGGSAGSYFGYRRDEGSGGITVVIEGDIYGDGDAFAEKVVNAIERGRRSGRVRGDNPTVIRG